MATTAQIYALISQYALVSERKTSSAQWKYGMVCGMQQLHAELAS